MNEPKSKSLRERVASAVSGKQGLTIDPDAVKELARLLEETGLGEIEIEQAGTRLRVARAIMPTQYALAPTHPAPPQAAAPTAPAPAAKRGTIVTSPMVGTVFLSPQPGAPPFVKIGDKVTDETICIVEAMKTMNPVAASIPGRIAEIFVHDGQPVEFGEPLMSIE